MSTDTCWRSTSTITNGFRSYRESVLGSTEQQLAVRATQVGFWARINSVLLDGPNGRQVRTSSYVFEYSVLTIPNETGCRPNPENPSSPPSTSLAPPILLTYQRSSPRLTSSLSSTFASDTLSSHSISSHARPFLRSRQTWSCRS